MRPGGFDRHIVVPCPDVHGRQEILELISPPVADDVDIKAIAHGTPGFTSAACSISRKWSCYRSSQHRRCTYHPQSINHALWILTGSTGASDELKKATELAKRMVTTCGMSDAIGLVHIDEAGADMQKEVDPEVRKLLRESYQRAKDLLKKHEKALDALANAPPGVRNTQWRRHKAGRSAISRMTGRTTITLN
ncbi:ATP-dependent zinc metalloprotease FTSH 11, chloroplastic/mitochondrial-like protein [Drosera capensis]